MPPQTEPLFLARETYRRRRLMDAARLSPFLAVFLFIAPVLWSKGTETLWGMLYLFGAWIGLIVLMAVIAPALSRARPMPPEDEHEDSEAG